MKMPVPPECPERYSNNTVWEHAWRAGYLAAGTVTIKTDQARAATLAMVLQKLADEPVMKRSHYGIYLQEIRTLLLKGQPK
jgi:hypothetical protein